jgi:DNA-directed RNA polymerase specialized sigma subunit
MDDILAAGNEGFMVAFNKYDKSRSNFTTMANNWIKKYMRNEAINRSYLIKHPVGILDRKSRVIRAIAESKQKFGHVDQAFVMETSDVRVWETCMELVDFQFMDVISLQYGMKAIPEKAATNSVLEKSPHMQQSVVIDEINKYAQYTVQLTMLDDSLPEEYVSVLQDIENGMSIKGIARKYGLTENKAAELVEGVKEIEDNR